MGQLVFVALVPALTITRMQIVLDRVALQMVPVWELIAGAA